MKRNIAFIVCLLLAASLFASLKPVVSINPFFTFDNSPSGIELGHGTWKQSVGLQNPDWWETRQDYWNKAFDKMDFMNLGFVVDTDMIDIVSITDILQDSFMQFTNDGRIMSNVPFVNGASVDLTFPRVSYIDYTNNGIYLSIGRRQIKWGPSTYDMAISNSQPFLDNFYGSYTTDISSKWDFTYSFMGIAYKHLFDVGVPATGAPQSTFTHRFIFENDNIRLSFAELNNIYGKQASLLDFSPLALWHDNFQDDCSNVMINVAAEGKIGPVRLYGTFTMDDFALGAEVAAGEKFGDKPTAMGFTAGIDLHLIDGEEVTESNFRYSDYVLAEKTFKERSGLNLSYEFFLCSTFMYNRENNPAGQFTSPFQFNSIAGYVGKFYDDDAFYLGFKYGPNTMVNRVSLEYVDNPIQAHVTAELISRGSYYINSPYNRTYFNAHADELNAIRLSGAVINALKVEAGISYALQDALVLKASAGFTKDLTHGTQSIQATLGSCISVCDIDWKNIFRQI